MPIVVSHQPDLGLLGQAAFDVGAGQAEQQQRQNQLQEIGLAGQLGQQQFQRGLATEELGLRREQQAFGQQLAGRQQEFQEFQVGAQLFLQARGQNLQARGQDLSFVADQNRLAVGVMENERQRAFQDQQGDDDFVRRQILTAQQQNFNAQQNAVDQFNRLQTLASQQGFQGGQSALQRQFQAAMAEAEQQFAMQRAQAEFEMRGSLADQDLTNQQSLFDHRMTTQNRMELERLNNYEAELRGLYARGELTDGELQLGLRQAAAQRAGIQPQLVPRPRPQWRPGRGVGEIWTEPINMGPGQPPSVGVYTRDENGIPKLLLRPDQLGGQAMAPTAAEWSGVYTRIAQSMESTDAEGNIVAADPQQVARRTQEAFNAWRQFVNPRQQMSGQGGVNEAAMAEMMPGTPGSPSQRESAEQPARSAVINHFGERTLDVGRRLNQDPNNPQLDQRFQELARINWILESYPSETAMPANIRTEFQRLLQSVGEDDALQGANPNAPSASERQRRYRQAHPAQPGIAPQPNPFLSTGF